VIFITHSAKIANESKILKMQLFESCPQEQIASSRDLHDGDTLLLNAGRASDQNCHLM
jgi:hypothetical protein